MENHTSESKEEEEKEVARLPFRIPNIALATNVGDVDSVAGSEHPFAPSPVRSPPYNNVRAPPKPPSCFARLLVAHPFKFVAGTQTFFLLMGILTLVF